MHQYIFFERFILFVGVQFALVLFLTLTALNKKIKTTYRHPIYLQLRQLTNKCHLFCTFSGILKLAQAFVNWQAFDRSFRFLQHERRTTMTTIYPTFPSKPFAIPFHVKGCKHSWLIHLLVSSIFKLFKLVTYRWKKLEKILS